ncbi:MFS transporter [Actinophytocola sp. NPDC049390]|uniref:MFS transporter n=1 Tax=Actinophytocola sp. NPDC049390 TaxID=3363894 RepID=UPI0037BD2B31
MTATLDAPVLVAPAAHPRRWLGLFAILGADLLNLLDSTVGTIAAPAIQADLGGSTATLQWIAAGYTLAMAVGLLVGGRLGDMYGRKRMMIVGVLGFLGASLLCAVAFSPETLLVARVLQGGFGAVMVPQSFGLIRELFGAEVGKAFALLGPVIGLATVLGPVVAGLLVDADVFGTGWRMVFAINIPLGAFALAVGARVLPDSPPAARGQRLDVRGALLAAAGMFLLVYPLTQGHELGWPLWSFGMLAASVVVLAVFAATQRGDGPVLVRLSVFARRSYSSGVVFVVAFFGVITGFSLAVGLFLQLGLGYSPLKASLTMAPWAVGAFVGSAVGASVLAGLGRRVLHLGLGLMTAGLTWLYFSLSVDGPPVAPLAVFGAGMGMIFVPLFDIIVGDLADDEVGSASGILTSVQQLGASLGIAVLGTVFFSNVDAPAAPAFVDAAKVVTLVAIALTAVTFGLGFLLPRKAKNAAH